MALLFRLLAFALCITLALVTYRLWRQQRRPDRGWLRAFAAASVVFALLLFHQTVRELLPAGIPRTAGTRTSHGREVMEKLGCGSCHSVGGGVVVGPDLKRAALKYDRDTLLRFIEDPEKVYAERHRHPLNEGFTEMPSLGVDEHDAEEIAEYLSGVAEH